MTRKRNGLAESRQRTGDESKRPEKTKAVTDVLANFGSVAVTLSQRMGGPLHLLVPQDIRERRHPNEELVTYALTEEDIRLLDDAAKRVRPRLLRQLYGDADWWTETTRQ
jgi:hypothetical protein